MKKQTAAQAERALVSSVLHEIQEEERLAKAITTKLHFSEWTKWDDVIACDFSWNFLANQSESYLGFMLNAVEDTLPTPSVLKCWRQAGQTGRCPLGCGQAGSLKHILCCCPVAHNAPFNRIEWRHDSILLAIFKAVKSRAGRQDSEPQQETVFRKESGSPAIIKPTAPRRVTAILDRADDWQFQFDLPPEDGTPKPKMTFPESVAIVSGRVPRPDGIMWSEREQSVVWIELASP